MTEVDIKPSLTPSELFIYISTSLAFSPLLDGIKYSEKTKILKKVCKEMDLLCIQNGEVYRLMNAVEDLRLPLGRALIKVIGIDANSIARNNILSNPKLVEQSIKMIKDNPDLIKQIQKTLSEKQ